MANATFSNGYALLIGVGGTKIEITVDDAIGLHDVLVNPSRAAYPSGQVKLLTEADADRKGILDGFDWLIQQVQGNADATVIVYFSGHGIKVERQDKPTEYFLIPHGYIPGEYTTTAISGWEFTNKIEAIKARKLVVLLDCCHAGGVPTLKGPGKMTVKSMNLPPALLNILDTGGGRVIVASSREEEASWTGTPYSVFTACLIEALSGKGATNKDGFARILNILPYLTDHVPERTGRQQNPLISRLDNADNFPLCYYAGGSKDIPDDDYGLTPLERAYWKDKKDIYLADQKARLQLVLELGEDLRTETRLLEKRRIEKQIQEQESALNLLLTEIRGIERKLQ